MCIKQYEFLNSPSWNSAGWPERFQDLSTECILQSEVLQLHASLENQAIWLCWTGPDGAREFHRLLPKGLLACCNGDSLPAANFAGGNKVSFLL